MEAELRELIAKKDALETEIKQLNHKCEAIDQSKSFSKNLVDSEGFPRPDLDFGELADYRNTKRRLNELNNDHLALMREIESKLYLLHEQKRKDPNFMASLAAQTAKEAPQVSVPVVAEIKPSSTSPKKEQPTKKEYEIDYLTPFARLSVVEENSPAQVGGLKSGDLLSQFASINIYTPDSIKQIPHVVVENKPLRIVVLRELTESAPNDTKVHTLSGKDYTKHVLQIKPERWAGRGLLGCKIDPLH